MFSFSGLIVSGQELVVTHAPSYVKFQEQKQTLQTSDVPHVITHTLGIPTNKVS